MKDYTTQEWRNALEIQRGIDDVKLLLHELSLHQFSWPAFLKAERESRGLKTAVFAARCGVTRQGAEKWLNKGVLPDSREAFIRIGMAFGMNITEMNRLIQRYGKYPALYAKNIDDAICMFVINGYSALPDRGLSSESCPYEQVKSLKAKLLACISEWDKSGVLDTYYATGNVQSAVLKANTEDSFIEFVHNNKEVFLSKAYRKLQERISDLIRMQVIDITDQTVTPSIHMLVQEGVLSKSFERMYTRLRAQDEAPSRVKIIAMGMCFNMTTEMIDKLLECARMEPLCPKDTIECALLYTIRTIHLLDPTMEYDIAMKLARFSQDSEVKKQSEMIMEKHRQMTVADTNQDTDFLCVNDYVKYVFEQLDISEQAAELLALLEADPPDFTCN